MLMTVLTGTFTDNRSMVTGLILTISNEGYKDELTRFYSQYVAGAIKKKEEESKGKSL